MAPPRSPAVPIATGIALGIAVTSVDLFAEWGSVVRLAAFTAAVAAAGMGSGLLLRRLASAGRPAA